MNRDELNNVARICAELGIPFNLKVAGIVEQRDALFKTWKRGLARSGLTIEDELETIRLGLQECATDEQHRLALDALGAIGHLLRSFRGAKGEKTCSCKGENRSGTAQLCENCAATTDR